MRQSGGWGARQERRVQESPKESSTVPALVENLLCAGHWVVSEEMREAWDPASQRCRGADALGGGAFLVVELTVSSDLVQGSQRRENQRLALHKDVIMWQALLLGLCLP